MNDFEIRRLVEDEWAAVFDLAGVAFGEEYTEEDLKAFREIFPRLRVFGAFERDRLVGSGAVIPMDLALPGRTSLPMGGLTWVGVLPTHRRRGVLRRLMRAMFADMIDHGEPLSGLGASESSIYGRFGYGPAVSSLAFSVKRPFAAFLDPVDPGAFGRIILLSAGEAAVQLPALYERLRPEQPGEVSRPEGWWKGHLADPPHDREGYTRLFHVLHESATGEPDGYVSYRLKDEWDNETAAVSVGGNELVAADGTVYKVLWDYLLRTDLSLKIGCWRGRVDEPLRWLLADPRRFTVEVLYDSLWVRLLDVPRALTARAYRCPGELVLEVHDRFPDPVTRLLRLRVDQADTAGAAEVKRLSNGSALPDLVLDVGTLGATYLGGVSFASLAAAGRVQEKEPATVELADKLFSVGRAPFCATDF